MLDQNLDLLEAKCAQFEALSHSKGSDPQRSSHAQFNYLVFSLTNSKVKFYRGSLSQTPIPSSRKKRVSNFESPCSVRSGEADHLLKLADKEDQLLMQDPIIPSQA